jgi:hypothetical protein
MNGEKKMRVEIAHLGKEVTKFPYKKGKDYTLNDQFYAEKLVLFIHEYKSLTGIPEKIISANGIYSRGGKARWAYNLKTKEIVKSDQFRVIRGLETTARAHRTKNLYINDQYQQF